MGFSLFYIKNESSNSGKQRFRISTFNWSEPIKIGTYISDDDVNDTSFGVLSKNYFIQCSRGTDRIVTDGHCHGYNVKI